MRRLAHCETCVVGCANLKLTTTNKAEEEIDMSVGIGDTGNKTMEFGNSSPLKGIQSIHQGQAHASTTNGLQPNRQSIHFDLAPPPIE